MAETARETVDDPSEGPAAPRTTFDELAAEPERVASEAASRPVRIDGPNGEALVLVDAAAFDRLRGARRVETLHVTELTDHELAMMDAQPIPDEGSEFDHEGDFVGHG